MSERNKEVEKFSSYSRRQQYWSPSTSLPRNPRIVRAPRDTGGKDRHSKVYTLRGLRDRRIRLSVPTAIQLYDLQDRLGLPQPSKVVDWLLDAAKNDIDRLPPLPAIPSLLPDHGQPPPAAHEGNIGGFQKFFPAGGGQCVLLPYDSNGSGNNDNSNYYSGNQDPAGLSLAMFGLGPQPAGEEKFLAFVSGTGSGSGSGSGPGPHHHLY